MIKSLLASAAATAAVFASAHAVEIKSTFDTDTEGFVLSGGDLAQLPSGVLQATDTIGTEMMLTLPSKFILPLSIGDSLSFDARETKNPDGDFGGFGEVTISNGTDSLTKDFFTGDLMDEWITVDVAFDGASWDTTDVFLAGILSGLTSIVINVESGSDISEVVLIDNVILTTTAVPVPAAALLFAPLAGVAALSRRRQRKH
ncbi:MAG: hypothetical protein AAF225_03420 [Pseudomonadota bacterium]